MPSITGGDQLDPDYAPHFYIGPKREYFVWQTAQELTLDGWRYRIGRVSDNRIVCERRPAAKPYDLSGVEMVPSDHIPSEVTALVQDVTQESVAEGIRKRVAELGVDASEPTGRLFESRQLKGFN